MVEFAVEEFVGLGVRLDIGLVIPIYTEDFSLADDYVLLELLFSSKNTLL